MFRWADVLAESPWQGESIAQRLGRKGRFGRQRHSGRTKKGEYAWQLRPRSPDARAQRVEARRWWPLTAAVVTFESQGETIVGRLFPAAFGTGAAPAGKISAQRFTTSRASLASIRTDLRCSASAWARPTSSRWPRPIRSSRRWRPSPATARSRSRSAREVREHWRDRVCPGRRLRPRRRGHARRAGVELVRALGRQGALGEPLRSDERRRTLLL